VQINGNAIVRNNIILHGKRSALRLGPEIEGWPRPRASDVVKAFNNVIFERRGHAVTFVHDLRVIFANNIVDGAVRGDPAGLATHNYWLAENHGRERIWEPPLYQAKGFEFVPSSVRFLNAGWAGDPAVPQDDFDGQPREGLPDIGAREMTTPASKRRKPPKLPDE